MDPQIQCLTVFKSRLEATALQVQIVETEETFEMVWRIPLNGSASKISKTDRYLKNGEVVEAARRDGRPGVLRSQLTFTPEGHVHIRFTLETVSQHQAL